MIGDLTLRPVEICGLLAEAGLQRRHLLAGRGDARFISRQRNLEGRLIYTEQNLTGCDEFVVRDRRSRDATRNISPDRDLIRLYVGIVGHVVSATTQIDIDAKQ